MVVPGWVLAALGILCLGAGGVFAWVIARMQRRSETIGPMGTEFVDTYRENLRRVEAARNREADEEAARAVAEGDRRVSRETSRTSGSLADTLRELNRGGRD